jgi:hypothetical protein
MAALGGDLLALLAEHASEERLALPLLRMVQLLLEAKRLDPLLIAPASKPAAIAAANAAPNAAPNAAGAADGAADDVAG